LSGLLQNRDEMRRKKIIFILFIADLFLISGFLTASGFMKFDSWRTKEVKKMLTESQKTSDSKEKILLLQKAAMLKPSEETYLLTGIALMQNEDEHLAGDYLKRVKTGEGYYQLSRAYYNQERLTEAKKTIYLSLAKNKTAKAYMLAGQIDLAKNDLPGALANFKESSKLNKNKDIIFYVSLLEFMNDKQYEKENLSEIYSDDIPTFINRTYAYLKGHSYPQTAFSFLEQKNSKSELNRDGYLYLADEYIERGQDEKAYQVLLSAQQKDMYFPQTYKQLIAVGQKLGKTTEVEGNKKFLQSISW
jgi:tetratricopeptide (TPR) repeat protein